MSKKKSGGTVVAVLGSIFGGLFGIGIIVLIAFLLLGRTGGSNTPSIGGGTLFKPKPYIEENHFKLVDATKDYKNPVYYYTKKPTGEIIDVGSKFKEGEATYHFYDYHIYDYMQDGDVIVSFKMSYEVPVEYVREDLSYQEKYHYTYSIIKPNIVDYYTGEEYFWYNNDEDKDKYYKNIIKWDDKEYEIGIRTETTTSWDGKEKIGENTYKDVSRGEVTYYISMPADYDGVLISIFKPGSTEELFNLSNKNNEKYEKLKKEAEETGEESEEYLKMKDKRETPRKLRESLHSDKLYDADDFYVFRAKDITPKED